MKKNHHHSAIGDALYRAATKLSHVLSHQNYVLDGEAFVCAEIRIVKCIFEHEDIHITGLADLLGVTKGAISQTAAKLEKKGVLRKEKDPRNLSRLFLSLTPKGEALYKKHEAIHRKVDRLMRDILEPVSDEHKAFLKDFLATLERELEAADFD